MLGLSRTVLELDTQSCVFTQFIYDFTCLGHDAMFPIKYFAVFFSICVCLVHVHMPAWRGGHGGS